MTASPGLVMVVVVIHGDDDDEEDDVDDSSDSDSFWASSDRMASAIALPSMTFPRVMLLLLVGLLPSTTAVSADGEG